MSGRDGVFLGALALAALAATGCASPPGSREPPAAAGATPGAGAPTGTVEKAAPSGDWCAEHGVPESACTKCKPALIAKFQAAGDWCAEHGFPESVCPLCGHGRPAPAGAGDAAGATAATPASPGDGAPATGTKVRFRDAEVARTAGLRIAQAEAAPAAAFLETTARIVSDPTRTAAVNARASGVIRSVEADIGARVSRGSPLAILDSPEIGAARSRLPAIRARLKTADAALERVEKLHERGIVAFKEVLEARQERESALAEVTAAEGVLALVGGEALPGGKTVLASPLSGVVAERLASAGALVSAGELLFRVVDPSRVWAEIDIPEADLDRVAPGAPVTFFVEAADGREFTGTLAAIAPEVDPRTRTVRGRVPIDNRDGALRANMFARARIARAPGTGGLIVPAAAVQDAHGAALVFVKLSDTLFEARRVRSRPIAAGFAQVTGDLRAGEPVVTEGSFLLKTETLRESIGAGCCDVE